MTRQIFRKILLVGLLVLLSVSAVFIRFIIKCGDNIAAGWDILLCSLWLPGLAIILLLLIVSGFAARYMTRQIIRQLNDIDFNDPQPGVICKELKPLTVRIKRQNNTVDQQAHELSLRQKEFTANVSHELKTPLTSISGFAELMKEGLVPAERVKEFSGDIYKESQRMINLVDDIINLSSLDEGTETFEHEVLDLYDLAAEIIVDLEPVAQKKQIAVSLQGSHVPVYGVWQIINEMIYNLCDNAIKYNKDGGWVTVSIIREADAAQLTVADGGIGIPEDHQKRIFERFYRVDKSHSRKMGGTGLGLSIVKHGAQYHNAGIELKSQAGVGTTITISFQAYCALQEDNNN